MAALGFVTAAPQDQENLQHQKAAKQIIGQSTFAAEYDKRDDNADGQNYGQPDHDGVFQVCEWPLKQLLCPPV